jgi:hypothetical protein
MIQTISVYDFRDAFKRYGRGDQFSYEGLELIFDYVEEYEQSAGEQVEFDVIGICCEWNEQELNDVFNTYPIECKSENPTEDEIKHAVLEYLHDETQVAGVTDSGTVVYVQF